MRKNIIEIIPENILNLLKEIGEAAQKFGSGAYAAGGFVRDLFIGFRNYDIDIVIEKDAVKFANLLAESKSLKVSTHKKFDTASIISADNFRIDIASARSEYYKSPASLPEVKPGSILEDITRRDFTINTILINICPDNFGAVTDMFSGIKDIENKTVKVLHDLSFIDDPTRILRAIRFERRFDFTIDTHTSELIENALDKKIIERLSGKRFFTELKYILKENNPLPPLLRLFDYKIIEKIHPDIRRNNHSIKLFASITDSILWYDRLPAKEPYSKWALYFMALIDNCGIKASEDICRNFQIPHNHKSLFCEKRLEAKKILEHIKKNDMSGIIYRRLSIFKTELILYMAALSTNPNKRKALFDLYRKTKMTRISITGEDLIAAGLKPGPIFSEIINDLFESKIKGEIRTKEDELNYIKKYL